ncbi:MAG: isoprenyl transferase [Candidatus Latescibacteria bacterium]|nr:isoprenyl transferase [Candidatus Latescibacterota bacterium]
MVKTAKPPDKIPVHIAIIMDGNGRWARKRGLPRFYGHKKGVDSVRNIVRAAAEFGVKHLTLYVFSSENWTRPASEIDTLMRLLEELLLKEEPELNKNNVAVRTIGQTWKLPQQVQDNLNYLIDKTKNNTGLVLVLALSYGARNEIVDAVKKIAVEKKDLSTLNSEEFGKYLYEPELPDPDLLIRTAGEKRISNYLLWQSAYTELYFTDVLWPDFGKKQLLTAIEDYALRKRKFGGLEIE